MAFVLDDLLEAFNINALRTFGRLTGSFHMFSPALPSEMLLFTCMQRMSMRSMPVSHATPCGTPASRTGEDSILNASGMLAQYAGILSKANG
jgi:hypothetical protein